MYESTAINRNIDRSQSVSSSLAGIPSDLRPFLYARDLCCSLCNDVVKTSHNIIVEFVLLKPKVGLRA